MTADTRRLVTDAEVEQLNSAPKVLVPDRFVADLRAGGLPLELLASDRRKNIYELNQAAINALLDTREALIEALERHLVRCPLLIKGKRNTPLMALGDTGELLALLAQLRGESGA